MARSLLQFARLTDAEICSGLQIFCNGICLKPFLRPSRRGCNDDEEKVNKRSGVVVRMLRCSVEGMYFWVYGKRYGGGGEVVE